MEILAHKVHTLAGARGSSLNPDRHAGHHCQMAYLKPPERPADLAAQGHQPPLLTTDTEHRRALLAFSEIGAPTPIHAVPLDLG